MLDKSLCVDDLKLLAATLSSIGDGVISTDLSGKINYINSAAGEITGWRSEEALEKAFDQVFTLKYADTNVLMPNPVAYVLKEKKTTGLLSGSVLVSKNAEQKYVSATCSPILIKDNSMIGVVVAFRDITRLKKLELAHLHQENNIQTILNNAPVGMVTLGGSGSIEEINDMALLITGKSKEKVVGTCFGEGFNCIASHDDPKGCGFGPRCPQCEVRKAHLLSVEKNKATRDIEFSKTLTKEKVNNEYWFRVSITPVIIDNEVKSVVTLLDITERKREEIRTAQARDYSNNLLDQLPCLVFKSDSQLSCEYANKMWQHYTGLPIEKLSGYGWADVIHPEDLERYMKARSEAISHGNGFNVELRMRRHDGQFRWCVIVGTPYRDLNEEFSGYIGTIYDITEPKMAKDVIAQSQANYRSLLMNMHSGYATYQLIYDEQQEPVDLLFVETNEAFSRLFNIDGEEIIGRSFSEVFHQSPQELINNVLKQRDILLKGHSVHFDEIYFDVSDRWFSVSIYTPNHRDIIAIVTDITYLKSSEKKLIAAKEAAEAAYKAKSEFLANISHEIRTPINGMVGMLDLTLLTALNGEQKDNLVTAKLCANNLLRIINDVLDFSKMEAGKLSIRKSSFNVREFITEIIKTHMARLSEKGLDLSYSISPSIPDYLIGDANRLKQVLNNLISNAIKFTDYGSIILTVKNMGVDHENVRLSFAVKDTGIGIAPEDIGRLFKSFSQVDGSFTKRFGGTGLGLAISKQLVEMMGGTIDVESERGKGSRFFFTLSLKIGNKVEDHSHLLPEISKGGKQYSILLVEDDAINRKVIIKMLKKKGYTIDSAGNGIEALRLFEPGKYDAVLMDIQMPEMDGIEATRRIREKEGQGGHTPVIAITAYALKGDRERFLSLGMDDYLSKPIDMEQLYRTIETIGMNHRVNAKTPRERFLSENSEIKPVKTNRSLSRDTIMAEMKGMEESIGIVLVACENQDLDLIEASAHKIKVSADRIEIGEIKDIAFKIELAARRGNLNEANRYSEFIREEFESFKKSIT